MRTRPIWLLFVASGTLLAVLTTGRCTGATAGETQAQATPRVMGGHLFIPSALVPDPFISTSFMTTTGAGEAVNIAVPIYNLRGQQIDERSADIGFFLLGFDYQQRISNKVAARLSLNGSGRLGTNAPSIVAEGITAVYGYGIGASVNLVRKPNWQLAVTGDVRGNTLYGISPLAFVQSAIDNAANGDSSLASSEDSLLNTGDNSRFVGGARAAYAPADWIGFTGFVEFGVGKKFEGREANTSVANVGATASVDFNALTDTPIGLLLLFRQESLNEKSENVGRSDAFGIGIFYTGRQDFSIGLETTTSKLDQPRTDRTINALGHRLLMRYDFR